MTEVMSFTVSGAASPALLSVNVEADSSESSRETNSGGDYDLFPTFEFPQDAGSDDLSEQLDGTSQCDNSNGSKHASSVREGWMALGVPPHPYCDFSSCESTDTELWSAASSPSSIPESSVDRTNSMEQQEEKICGNNTVKSKANDGVSPAQSTTAANTFSVLDVVTLNDKYSTEWRLLTLENGQVDGLRLEKPVEFVYEGLDQLISVLLVARAAVSQHAEQYGFPLPPTVHDPEAPGDVGGILNVPTSTPVCQTHTHSINYERQRVLLESYGKCKKFRAVFSLGKPLKEPQEFRKELSSPYWERDRWKFRLICPRKKGDRNIRRVGVLVDEDNGCVITARKPMLDELTREDGFWEVVCKHMKNGVSSVSGQEIEALGDASASTAFFPSRLATSTAGRIFVGNGTDPHLLQKLNPVAMHRVYDSPYAALNRIVDDSSPAAKRKRKNVSGSSREATKKSKKGIDTHQTLDAASTLSCVKKKRKTKKKKSPKRDEVGTDAVCQSTSGMLFPSSFPTYLRTSVIGEDMVRHQLEMMKRGHKKKPRVLSSSAPCVPTSPLIPLLGHNPATIFPGLPSMSGLGSDVASMDDSIINSFSVSAISALQRAQQAAKGLLPESNEQPKSADDAWSSSFRHICLEGIDPGRLFEGKEADKVAVQQALTCFDRIMNRLTHFPVIQPPLMSVEQTASLDTANSTSLMGNISGWFAHQVDESYLSLSVSVDGGNTFQSDIFTCICERHDESITSALSLQCNGRRGNLLRIPSGSHLVVRLEKRCQCCVYQCGLYSMDNCSRVPDNLHYSPELQLSNLQPALDVRSDPFSSIGDPALTRYHSSSESPAVGGVGYVVLTVSRQPDRRHFEMTAFLPVLITVPQDSTSPAGSTVSSNPSAHASSSTLHPATRSSLSASEWCYSHSSCSLSRAQDSTYLYPSRYNGSSYGNATTYSTNGSVLVQGSPAITSPPYASSAVSQ